MHCVEIYYAGIMLCIEPPFTWPGFLFREWAERHGIQSEKPENLISDKAAKLYRVRSYLMGFKI